MRKLSKKATAIACSIFGVLLVLLIGLFVCKNAVEYEFTTISQLNDNQLALLEQSTEDWAVPAEHDVIRLSLGNKEAFLVPMVYVNIKDVGASSTSIWTTGIKFLCLSEDTATLLHASKLENTITAGDNTGIWYRGDFGGKVDNIATQRSERREDWWFEYSLGALDSNKEFNVPRDAVIEFSGEVRPKGFPFNLIKISFDIDHTQSYTENTVLLTSSILPIIT